MKTLLILALLALGCDVSSGNPVKTWPVRAEAGAADLLEPAGSGGQGGSDTAGAGGLLEQAGGAQDDGGTGGAAEVEAGGSDAGGAPAAVVDRCHPPGDQAARDCTGTCADGVYPCAGECDTHNNGGEICTAGGDVEAVQKFADVLLHDMSAIVDPLDSPDLTCGLAYGWKLPAGSCARLLAMPGSGVTFSTGPACTDPGQTECLVVTPSTADRFIYARNLWTSTWLTAEVQSSGCDLSCP